MTALIGSRPPGRRRMSVGRRGGMRRTNVEPSPSSDDDQHLAAVVRGDVADDRQPEPGAAGRRGCGPVDAVEALEDAVEVAGPGCRCRGRRPSARPTSPSTRTRTCTDDAGVAVLDGVLDEVAERRHELTAVAERRARRRSARAPRSRRARVSASGSATARPRPRRRRARRPTSRTGSSPSSMRDSSSRSSIVCDDAVRPRRSCGPRPGGRRRGRPRRPASRRARRAHRRASSARGRCWRRSRCARRRRGAVR